MANIYYSMHLNTSSIFGFFTVAKVFGKVTPQATSEFSPCVATLGVPFGNNLNHFLKFTLVFLIQNIAYASSACKTTSLYKQYLSMVLPRFM